MIIYEHDDYTNLDSMSYAEMELVKIILSLAELSPSTSTLDMGSHSTVYYYQDACTINHSIVIVRKNDKASLTFIEDSLEESLENVMGSDCEQIEGECDFLLQTLAFNTDNGKTSNQLIEEVGYGWVATDTGNVVMEQWLISRNSAIRTTEGVLYVPPLLKKTLDAFKNKEDLKTLFDEVIATIDK